MNIKNKFFKKPMFWVILIVVCAVFSFVMPVYAFGNGNKLSEKELQKKQYLEVINSVYGFMLENYVDEVDPKVLYEGALRGLLESVEDPYTVYMDQDEVRSLNDTTYGEFGGVGLSIVKPIESTAEKPAYVEVVSPVEGTPGWRAGIQSGDYIIKIDDTLTENITMDEVLAILRGEVGDPVDVTFLRGESTEFTITMVRELIEVPTVKFGMINDNGRNVGYVRIIEFTPLTPEKVQEAINSFESNNYDSLIIDLRNNPGGLITSVADVADKFIDSGVIVSTKSRLMFENMVYSAEKNKTTVQKGIPIVVLINQGSASASEILAGALKDYHLAYLVGEKTFGKGSVQQVLSLPNSDAFKLTMAKYYTPSDTNIDKIGIPPDLEVLFTELNEEEAEIYIDLLLTDDISEYVKNHKNMSESEISKFAKVLQKDFDLDLDILERQIRIKAYPDMLYDLKFDVQLNKALEVLEMPNFHEMVKSAKTLSELQELNLAESEE